MFGDDGNDVTQRIEIISSRSCYSEVQMINMRWSHIYVSVSTAYYYCYSFRAGFCLWCSSFNIEADHASQLSQQSLLLEGGWARKWLIRQIQARRSFQHLSLSHIGLSNVHIITLVSISSSVIPCLFFRCLSAVHWCMHYNDVVCMWQFTRVGCCIR